MKYAVVTCGNTQYKVIEGDVITVDRLQTPVAGEYIFQNVLLIVDGDNFHIGHPFVSNSSVKGTVVENKKGKKIRVAKFKAKARYRRVMGFGPSVTKVRIENIRFTENHPSSLKRSITRKKSS